MLTNASLYCWINEALQQSIIVKTKGPKKAKQQSSITVGMMPYIFIPNLYMF